MKIWVVEEVVDELLKRQTSWQWWMMKVEETVAEDG